MVISCEICEIFKSTFFYKTSPVAVSEGFRFPACNFIKKETPEKMFFCELCKIFKNIFSLERTPPDGCFLCLSVNFDTFLEHLGETAILCTGCRISTTRYTKKQVLFKVLFHRRFSSILYKTEKFEGLHSFKIPENSL